MIRCGNAILVLAAGFLALAAGPAAALDGPGGPPAQSAAYETPPDAPPPPRYRRARTRIEVRPVRPPHRECTFRLVQELRPSGTVIVPRERCRWVP
jgi:hypothetical protein